MAQQVEILDHRGQPMAMQDSAHHGASMMSREMRNWTPGVASADADLLDELETLVGRQRDLVRNHGIAQGSVQTLVDNVVGTGFRLSCRPNHRVLGWTKQQADDWARDVEAKWRTWADTTECDAARQMNFASLTALQFRTGMMNGEALAVPVYLRRNGAKWRTAMQLVDPDRMDTPAELTTDPNIRRGIRQNRYGEALGYWIAKRHPVDVPFHHLGIDEWEYVPARTRFGRRRVLHLHDKERTGQSRGKPIMSSVLGNFRMLGEYQRSELKSALVGSMVAAFVESPMGPEQLLDMFGGEAAGEGRAAKRYMQDRSGWDVNLEGGAVIPLYPGDKVSGFNPNRPSGVYKDFVETIVREIGVSYGLPYELIMKDFSKTNYSSARAALLEAWRFFAGRRAWITSYWCQPAFELWLEEAVQRGEVEAPDFYDNFAAYTSAAWIGNGRGNVDPLKEASAKKLEMDSYQTTLQEVAMERGMDWRDMLEQRASEDAYMRELGLQRVDVNGQAVQDADDPALPSNDPDNGNTPDEEGA